MDKAKPWGLLKLKCPKTDSDFDFIVVQIQTLNLTSTCVVF